MDLYALIYGLKAQHHDGATPFIGLMMSIVVAQILGDHDAFGYR